MKITIDISDNYVESIKKYASVSRTLNESKRLLEEYLAGEEDEEFVEEIDYNISELREIEPWLNHIHYLLRNEIWNIERSQ